MLSDMIYPLINELFLNKERYVVFILREKNVRKIS